jgi:hypothetical protein
MACAYFNAHSAAASSGISMYDHSQALVVPKALTICRGELQQHTLNHGSDPRAARRPRVSRPRTAPRAMQACRACASSKTKCDNERLCRRCRRRGTSCIRPTDHATALYERDDDREEAAADDGHGAPRTECPMVNHAGDAGGGAVNAVLSPQRLEQR